ncbi:MAG TPA: JAB domain-containing protein [Herpetosiphonaceae bacterium]
MIRVLSAVLRPLPAGRVTCPADGAALLMAEMSHLQQEQLRVICLDILKRVQTIHTVYQGQLSAVESRTIELFREAFRRNSAAIILVHNHPSGDLLVTRQAVIVGKLLDVEVLDHLIIGRGHWVSLREKFPQKFATWKT